MEGVIDEKTLEIESTQCLCNNAQWYSLGLMNNF
jgi:hypothetical protein